MSATDQTQMTALAQASSAAHPVPDRGHVNNYREDTELQQLLALYLPADLYAHLQPYFDRMGELAGGAVDDWALEADRNPPTLSHQAAQETRDVAQGTRGHLRLGFVGSSLYRGLPQALAQLQQSHPQVRVDMLEANSAEQVQRLQQMRLDVALVHSIKPPEGIASELIVAEPFVVCLPQQHRLGVCTSIDLSALREERLILFSDLVSPTYHQRIYEMCLAHGFAPEVRHEVRHWLSVISLVSLGQGVALVPAALERVGMPRITFRPLRGAHPHSEMLAMWRSSPANPLVQALLAHLRTGVAPISRTLSN